MENENFLSENKFMSLFFWQEFDIKNQSSRSHSKSTTIVEKETLIKRSASFCSVNTDTLSLADPTHEYKEYKNRVKLYISIFKEHIFKNEHPLNIIARHFIKVFSAYIEQQIKLMEFNKANVDFCNFGKRITEEITKSLQKFIINLQTALRLMYCKTINYQCFIEERDEFINLITSLIFKEGKIYDNLFKLYELSMYEQINLLTQKMTELKT